MNSTEIANIITEINKELDLGVTKLSQLIPLLQQYNIIKYGSYLGISGIILIVCVILFILGIKKKANSDIWDTVAFVCFIIGIFAIVIFLSNLPEFIGWIYCPEIKSIEFLKDFI